MRSNIYNSSFFHMFTFIHVVAGWDCLANLATNNQKVSRNMLRAYMQVSILKLEFIFFKSCSIL